MDMMSLRRTVINGQHLETVHSGNTQDCTVIAHFSTPTPVKMQSLIVDLPYKATGYASVKIKHTGVNLLQCNTFRDGTLNNISFTGYRNAGGEIEKVHIQNTASANNIFRNLNYDTSNPYQWPPDGAYATYTYSSSANINFVGNQNSPYDRDGNRWGGPIGSWKIYDLAHDSDNQQEWMRIQLQPYNCSGVNYNDDLYPILCLESDVGCEFEPYKGTTYIISFSTIYGGTVDLINGKVAGIYTADGTNATPTEQTIAAQSINTLKGINNVWSDAGTISIKYFTH